MSDGGGTCHSVVLAQPLFPCPPFIRPSSGSWLIPFTTPLPHSSLTHLVAEGGPEARVGDPTRWGSERSERRERDARWTGHSSRHSFLGPRPKGGGGPRVARRDPSTSRYAHVSPLLVWSVERRPSGPGFAPRRGEERRW